MHRKRQKEMLSYLSEVKFAKTEQLAVKFCVSAETIRRDLLELEEAAFVKRVRGGAIYTSVHPYEFQSQYSNGASSAEVQAIAKLTCEMIRDGEAVAVNNSAFGRELARFLLETKKQLTVVTNSPKLAMMLNETKSHVVYLTSGRLQNRNKSVTGSMCIACLGNFKVDKAIVSVDGISIADGAMAHDREEADVIRKMLEISHTKIVLCPYEAFHKTEFHKACPAKQIDYIITDWNISSKEIKNWSEIQVKVLAAAAPLKHKHV
ncbi:MAG: DeoR/GlpR transcriptional regulator [Lachnospiraceae bacterium]|jgi:DeoR/GlpR family transcriptional regulator of sugar metabolism|nr:DeoR/GlpR transcriptional regulator [Lachnospiraceae bacterium]